MSFPLLASLLWTFLATFLVQPVTGRRGGGGRRGGSRRSSSRRSSYRRSGGYYGGGRFLTYMKPLRGFDSRIHEQIFQFSRIHKQIFQFSRNLRTPLGAAGYDGGSFAQFFLRLAVLILVLIALACIQKSVYRKSTIFIITVFYIYSQRKLRLDFELLVGWLPTGYHRFF